MKQIGFKNFKRFRNLEPVELGGISILVGPNNSGKSTVVKALILVLNFLQKNRYDWFDFDGSNISELGITNFGRAQTFGVSDPIEFNFGMEGFIFQIHVDAESDEMGSGRICYLQMASPDNGLRLEIWPLDGIRLVLSSFNRNSTPIESYDISELIKGKKKQLRDDSDALTDRQKFELQDQIQGLKDKLQHIESSNKKPASGDPADYLIDMFLEDELITNSSEEESYEYRPGYVELEQLGIEYLNLDSIRELVHFFQNEAQKMDESDVKDDENPISHTNTGKFGNDGNLEEIFRNIEFHLSSQQVYFLGTTFVIQSTIYSVRDPNNALAKVFHQFSTRGIEPGDPAYRFILKWIKELGVGDSFKLVKYDGGEAYSLKVIQGMSKIHLADLGVGSSQLVLLLFQLASVIHDRSGDGSHWSGTHTVFIEEPEMNLHPKIQSRLAEIFYEVWAEYMIDFVLETHSEYLIRQTQLIVKQKELQSEGAINPFRTTYFPSVGKPYPMRYAENGKFLDEFGSGFFDLNRDLIMKLL